MRASRRRRPIAHGRVLPLSVVTVIFMFRLEVGHSVRAAALALVLAFAFVATSLVAHAQPTPSPSVVKPTLSVFVDDPGRTMTPGRNESLDVHVGYAVGAGAVPGPGPNPDPTNGDPNSPNNTQRTRIHFAMKTTP